MDIDKRRKILVVDDSAVNILFITSLFKGDSYELYSANDGESAILKANKIEPDIILLDIMMPGMDGYEVCSILKKGEKTSNIPVIFLTAENEEESIVKAFEVGGKDYVTKPIRSKELLSRVKTHLEIKSQKEMLKSVNDLLEKKVDERTLQLKKANEELEKIDKVKSDFLGLISHELRTPLNGIVGFSEILLSMITDAEQITFIKEILKSSNSLLKLSDIALVITELKANKYQINIRKASIHKLIDDVIEKLKTQIEEKNITINVRIVPDNLAVNVDDVLIIDVLYNIIDNAVKYSKNNDCVQIDSYINDKLVKIEITDNGPGFSQKNLGNLFSILSVEDFDYHSKGFGLGLYFSKLIIDAHNGLIDVKNLDQRGAKVSISLKID